MKHPLCVLERSPGFHVRKESERQMVAHKIRVVVMGTDRYERYLGGRTDEIW